MLFISRLARRAGASIIALVLVGVVTACASGVPSGPGTPRLIPPPARLPPPESAGAGALLGGVEFRASSPSSTWGAGYLQALGAGAAWQEVSFPLFDAPAGRHWGWVAEGRGYDGDRGVAAPQRENALVRPPGEGRAYLVLQEAGGGWLEVRWGEPGDLRGGRGWTHPRLAEGGRLIYTAWSDAFQGAAGLVYRNDTVAHNLRAGPSANDAIVQRLTGDDFDMTALAMQGDWMRVRVSSPPACGGGSDNTGLLGASRPNRFVEGWIRWRSDQRGPWVRRTASAEVCQPVS